MTIRTTASWARRPAAMLAALALAVACSQGRETSDAHTSSPPPPTPAEHAEGERLFEANCRSCHGEYARGTTVGPPLVHAYYEPGHHSDAAFYYAAAQGVVQHHWRYGNMPAQPQVSRDQMAHVIAYVRWLQRLAGIE